MGCLPGIQKLNLFHEIIQDIFIVNINILYRSWDSGIVVGIVVYCLDYREVGPISILSRPIHGTTRVLSNMYWGPFPEGKETGMQS
jgi:hypothetical protein